ncbi:hypothetical protein MGH68_09985 [Erysipelothrix sp. D19-032]
MLTVINEFKFNGEYKNHKPVGDGHINDTYLVDFDTNQYVIHASIIKSLPIQLD